MGHGSASCLPNAPDTPIKDGDFQVQKKVRIGDRTLEEIELNPRELDSNGYRWTLDINSY